MLPILHTLGVLLAISPTPAPAVSPTPTAPPVIAHVYTADRHEEARSTSARTIYTVTREQIARYGYRTVAQALANVPGVEIAPYGALGSNVSFGIRGSSSNQVLVLIDGLPAPGNFDDTVELGNLPTTGVARIEVVEGGGSTLYGAGSLGGIINVITQGSAAYGALLRAGSFGERELDLNAPHLQFTRMLASNAFPLPGGGARPDSDYASTALHGDEEHRFGSIDAVVRGGFEYDHGGTPGSDAFLSPTSRENDVNEDLNLLLSHAGRQSQSALQLGGTTQQILFSCDPLSDANCGVSVPALTREGRLDVSARNVVQGADEEIEYGIDLSRGVVRSDAGGSMFLAPGVASISTDALAQSALYAQERFDLPIGNVYAGLRGERDGSLGGELSPSLGFIAHLARDFALKGNLASAFRAPNASELYFPGYGNPALAPERAQVADATLQDSAIAGGISLGWFTNRTNDLIVSTPVPIPNSNPVAYEYLPENVDHAFIQGFTFDARTLPLNGFTAAFNLTDLYRAQNLDAQSRLPNDPVVAANLQLEYVPRHANVLANFGTELHIAGPRGAVDLEQPAFDQPVAFTTWNAHASFRVAPTLLLTLRGYNLGNERYADAFAGYPMPGRSFAVEFASR